MPIFKSKVGLLAVIVVLILVLAACGSAATPDATIVPAPTSTSAPAATPTEAAVSVPTEAPAVEDTPAPAAAIATPTEVVTAEAAAAPTATAEPAPQIAANTRLNLNTATGEEYLSAIPDFSSRMVREFLEYRPYISIQQFRREIGKYVDDSQVTFYEQYVYVPIAVDEADAETLKQIPGVDDAVAAELIAGRPYGSNEAFLSALANKLSESEAAQAATYLVAP